LKEAFYKAQFPRWREFGNFRELALSVNLVKGTADIKEMDARFDSELAHLSFAFEIVDDFVISLAWA
jgi:4'-phosphopantetheinyl transferase EntD